MNPVPPPSATPPHTVIRQAPRPFSLSALAIALTGYLGLCSFVSAGTPILLGGDQVYFWAYAKRMLEGELPYRDFFQFTPPGTDLVYLAAFALFGPRIWVTNVVVIAIGLALGVVCYLAASRVAERAFAAIAAAFLVIFVYGRALNPTHHWFSVLGIVSAVIILSPRLTRPRLASAGAMLGLASFFTQSHGAAALLGFALYIAYLARRERLRRRQVADKYLFLLGGVLLALFSANAYFLFTVGIGPLFGSQVIYVWRHMAEHNGLWSSLGLAPETPAWHQLPSLASYLLVYALLPTVYSFALYYSWRHRHDPPCAEWNAVTLFCLVGISLLAEVLWSPNWLRLFAVAMPGTVLLAWTLDRTRRLRTSLIWICWLALGSRAMSHVRSMHRHYGTRIDLPAGSALSDALHVEKLAWIAQNTVPSDYFFAATWPSYYVLLDLRSPTYMDVVGMTAQTRPEFAERAISELETRRVKYTLWSTELDGANPRDPGARAATLLNAYIHGRYHLAHTFSDGDEVWERN